MDTQHMTQSESVRNPERSSPPASSGYAVAYVRDRFAIKPDTAATIARLAGLGEQEARR